MRRALIRHTLALFIGASGCSSGAAAPVEVIGHAGAGLNGPEVRLPPNSLPAIRWAVEGQAADGVEVDIQRSADGVFFLYHDSELETGTDCRGCIGEMTAAQLAKCRHRTELLAIGGPEKLLSLAEVLALYADAPRPPRFFLDVKYYPWCGPDDWTRVTAESLAEELTRRPARIPVAVQSAQAGLLNRMSAGGESAQRILRGQTVADVRDDALRAGADGVLLPLSHVTPRGAAAVREAGLLLYVYDVTTLAEADAAFALRPAGIQTDDVRLLRALVPAD